MALYFLKKRAVGNFPFCEEIIAINSFNKFFNNDDLAVAKSIKNVRGDKTPQYKATYNTYRSPSVTPVKLSQTKGKTRRKAAEDINMNASPIMLTPPMTPTRPNTPMTPMTPKTPTTPMTPTTPTTPSTPTRGKENRRAAAYVSPRRNVCKRCNERFQWKSALRKHEMYCSETYTCKLCNYTSSDKLAFARHTRREHSTPKNEFSCLKCEAKFTQARMLHLHNKCGCPKVFRNTVSAKIQVK